MTLVDTSVWIDFFASRELPHVDLLERLIKEEENIAICGINLTEVLQGIADEVSYRRIRQPFSDLILLPLVESTFVAAANCYRTLRTCGVTIRKTNDCIMAAVAMENDCELLHNDRDFKQIARYMPLRIAS